MMREAVERHVPTREASERGGVTHMMHVNAQSSYLAGTMKAVASGENSKSNGATRGNNSGKDSKEMSDSQFVRDKNSLLTEERRPIFLVALAAGAVISFVIAMDIKRTGGGGQGQRGGWVSNIASWKARSQRIAWMLIMPTQCGCEERELPR